MPEVHLQPMGELWSGSFSAMASPCHVLLEGVSEGTARKLTALVQAEAKRIELKFSRYRKDNIVHAINSSKGSPLEVDDETALLLGFADTCYELSEGMFDITSGILRKAWRFEENSPIPSVNDIDELRDCIGWNKVQWKAPYLTIREGMEIDLGGIGKEYAVDRCYELLTTKSDIPFLLNFGGDLRVNGERKNGSPWRVGVENPRMQQTASKEIDLSRGAIATSGDSQRFLMHKGKRYSHILNPKTGWPVDKAPRSVTVAAQTTLEAGMLATFASLKGEEAEDFLQNQNAQHWVLR